MKRDIQKIVFLVEKTSPMTAYIGNEIKTVGLEIDNIEFGLGMLTLTSPATKEQLKRLNTQGALKGIRYSECNDSSLVKFIRMKIKERVQRRCGTIDKKVPVFISDFFGISCRNLNEMLRKSEEPSLKQLEIDERMCYAEELLANKELSIDEVARILEYKRTPWFCTQFSENHNGVSPEDFRKTLS